MKLQPLTQRSFLVKEVEPISQSLTLLGLWGVDALDRLGHGQPISDSEKSQKLAIFESLKKPKAQLLLIPATAVQKLIEAAAEGGTCSAARP